MRVTVTGPQTLGGINLSCVRSASDSVAGPDGVCIAHAFLTPRLLHVDPSSLRCVCGVAVAQSYPLQQLRL